MGAKMKRRKFVRAGHKNDMWFIVEEVIYSIAIIARSEKSREYITRVFYNYDKALFYLNNLINLKKI